MNPPLSTVRTLICHGHVPMAQRCLDSLVRFNREPFRLRLHDDGTLTEEDRARLRSMAPDVSFIDRHEADAAMFERLARHPACLRYRQTQTMALKLFDVALLEPGDLHYCDCDILFLRPFAGFSAPLSAVPPMVLMRDLFNTYSSGWRRVLARNRVPLADRVNAGVTLLGAGRFDLDFIEWFLNRPEAADMPLFAEQTAWSALLQRDGGYVLDGEAFAFPPLAAARALPEASQRAVAWHYVSPLRRTLGEVADAVEADRTADALPPVHPAIFRPATLNFPRYGVSRWRKGRLARQLSQKEQPA